MCLFHQQASAVLGHPLSYLFSKCGGRLEAFYPPRLQLVSGDSLPFVEEAILYLMPWLKAVHLSVWPVSGRALVLWPAPSPPPQ